MSESTGKNLRMAFFYQVAYDVAGVDLLEWLMKFNYEWYRYHFGERSRDMPTREDETRNASCGDIGAFFIPVEHRSGITGLGDPNPDDAGTDDPD